MHIFTKVLCQEYKAPSALFSIPLVFIQVCGCCGRSFFSGLESSSSDKHSQRPLIVWPQTHEDAVAHPPCHTVLTNGKRGTLIQMGELLWTNSVQAFIRRRVLKSLQEIGEEKEMKKKYKTR